MNWPIFDSWLPSEFTDAPGFKSALLCQQCIVDTAAAFKYSYVSVPGIQIRRRCSGLVVAGYFYVTAV